METVQINKSNAISAYRQADENGKLLLANLFGKELFNQKVTERIKTFEDACLELGINATALPKNGLEKDAVSITAYSKLSIIVRALNEGWEPDWKNKNQYKYYPWFKSVESGSGLAYFDFDFTDAYSGTDVGSRLCFKTSELAQYAGQQFESIYNDFLTIQ